MSAKATNFKTPSSQRCSERDRVRVPEGFKGSDTGEEFWRVRKSFQADKGERKHSICIYLSDLQGLLAQKNIYGRSDTNVLYKSS